MRKQSATPRKQRVTSRRQGVLVSVRIQNEFVEALDQWRSTEFDMPNRAESVRRLTRWALKQHQARQPMEVR
jgi:metal-responsive CopG/Arc/MetJ family transcriptional regulator